MANGSTSNNSSVRLIKMLKLYIGTNSISLTELDRQSGVPRTNLRRYFGDTQFVISPKDFTGLIRWTLTYQPTPPIFSMLKLYGKHLGRPVIHLIREAGYNEDSYWAAFAESRKLWGRSDNALNLIQWLGEREPVDK